MLLFTSLGGYVGGYSGLSGHGLGYGGYSGLCSTTESCIESQLKWDSFLKNIGHNALGYGGYGSYGQSISHHGNLGYGGYGAGLGYGGN